MTSNGIVELTIPEKVPETGFLNFAFSGNDNIAVFCQKKKNSSSVDETGNHKIHLFKPQCLLFDEEVRKLVNESNSTFVSSRNVAESVYDLRSYYLSLSHEHRSSVRQCIENMQQKENDIPEYKEWIELFDNIEIVWHLCELIHIDYLPGDFVVGRLIEWVRFHCCEVELRASTLMLEDSPELTSPSDYWDLVTGLLLQARFEASRALLKLHSCSNTTPFIEADSILSTIPIFTPDCGLSVNEFMLRWKSWKSSTRAKIVSGIFSEYLHLQEIMEICAGEGSALLKRLKKYCDSWYQLLSASLVFADPTARLADLPYYANLCIGEFGDQSDLKLLDLTIQAIIESDLPKMISKLQMNADGGWSATHISNLLLLCGCFTSEDMNSEVESLLVEYGSLLFTDPCLYTAAAHYLEYCPTRGKRTLAVLLESIQLDSEAKAYRLLDIARRNKLHSVCRNICHCMGSSYLKVGNLDAALLWALESSDPELMSQVADKFLNSYFVNHSFSSSSLLYLGNSTAPSERLTFAAKFAEFNHLFSTNKMKEAADLLVSLMDVKVVPKFFYCHVLIDALGLLQLENPPLSMTQALVILECLEDAPKDCLPADMVSLLRAALSTHLATFMISDITLKNKFSDKMVIAERKM